MLSNTVKSRTPIVFFHFYVFLIYDENFKLSTIPTIPKYLQYNNLIREIYMRAFKILKLIR